MLEESSLDSDNQRYYGQKRKEWQNKNNILISQHANLRKNRNAYNTKNLNLTGKSLDRLQKENQNFIDKYSKYRYNESGNILATDDFKKVEHYKIPKEYKPYAVIETVETKKGITYINRTIYDSQSKMVKQVHTGNHAQPKEHPYGNSGEHMHDYIWKDGKLSRRATREITEVERKEHEDILWELMN